MLYRQFRHRWSTLTRQGVLGANCRSAEYLLPNNPRRYLHSVDDKLITKQICQACGIAVPQTYGVVERLGDVATLSQLVAQHQHFVVKPCSGSGGRGILVVRRKGNGQFCIGEMQSVSLDALGEHVVNILSGLYALDGQRDRALIEQRITPHPMFRDWGADGTPDIRIVLYRCAPVMAMIRLPTKASCGRANLHQGAVGVGIHLVTGETIGGVWKNRTIRQHPDTGRPLGGLRIPHWSRVLGNAIKLSKSLRIGYIGVDFVLDHAQGPVVLEANARPGLAIQLANRQGLRAPLNQIDRQAVTSSESERHRTRLKRLAAACRISREKLAPRT